MTIVWGLVRCLSAFLALGMLLGIGMYPSVVHPASLGVPVALLTLSVAPTRKTIPNVIAIGLASALLLLDYGLAGIPFLDDVNQDWDSRAWHFAAFVLICALFVRRLFVLRRLNAGASLTWPT